MGIPPIEVCFTFPRSPMFCFTIYIKREHSTTHSHYKLNHKGPLLTLPPTFKLLNFTIVCYHFKSVCIQFLHLERGKLMSCLKRNCICPLVMPCINPKQGRHDDVRFNYQLGLLSLLSSN